MDRINKLKVFYNDREVGTMALYQNRLAAFEYASEWIADGFSISPFSLPLEKKVFLPKIEPFEGSLHHMTLPISESRNTTMLSVQKKVELKWKK